MHTDPSNRDRFCFPMNLHRQLGNVVGGEIRALEVFYFIYKTQIIQRFKHVNPLSAGDAFKRIHTVFPQLKFDRN